MFYLNYSRRFYTLDILSSVLPSDPCLDSVKGNSVFDGSEVPRMRIQLCNKVQCTNKCK